MVYRVRYMFRVIHMQRAEGQIQANAQAAGA
jgi:hypothetical protein